MTGAVDHRRSARCSAGSSSTIRIRAPRVTAARAGGLTVRPRACIIDLSRPGSDWVLLIERDVQVQHVYPGLAEEPDRAALGVLPDQGHDRGRADLPCGRDPVDLDGGVLRRDVRVQAGT